MEEPSTKRLRTRIASPLSGVSDAQWEKFRAVLEVQPIRAVSASGGFGAFDMRPRRLAELGYVHNLRQARSESGRLNWCCDFVAPWTQDRFLSDLMAQHAALAKSMTLYLDELQGSDLKKPDSLSLSSTLVVLHIAGKRGLGQWGDAGTRMANTQAMANRAEGIF